MLPPPDFESLVERFESGRRTSPPLMLLGRGCGRLAGTPELEDVARQALTLLEPDGSVEFAPSVDRSALKQVQRAFLSAFPTASALQQMVSYGLSKQPPLEAWAREPLTSTVTSLLEWAASTGQLDRLVSAAITYNPGNPALKAVTGRWAHKKDSAENEKLLAEFRSRFGDLSTLERYSLLQTIYSRIPVPAFYQDLARIIKGGYVRQILTTNIDSLLEQALEGMGLSRDVDYFAIPLGTQYSREAIAHLEQRKESEANRPVLLELYGDISQGEFNIALDELEHALKIAKRFITSELEGDVVLVGYESECPPLNDWLARSPATFWAIASEPSESGIGPSRLRSVELSPPDFFAALAARLFALRVTASPSASKSFAAKESVSAPPPQNEQLLLRQELDRLKAETASLEQSLGSTATPLQLQEQLAQRKERIRALEDQLRALPAAREEILALLDRLEQSMIEPDVIHVDPKTIAYASEQVKALRDEYQASQPNQHVVSAAIGATLVLAERLGPTVFNPQDVQALAAFGPSLGARV